MKGYSATDLENNPRQLFQSSILMSSQCSITPKCGVMHREYRPAFEHGIPKMVMNKNQRLELSQSQASTHTLPMSYNAHLAPFDTQDRKNFGFDYHNLKQAELERKLQDITCKLERIEGRLQQQDNSLRSVRDRQEMECEEMRQKMGAELRRRDVQDTFNQQQRSCEIEQLRQRMNNFCSKDDIGREMAQLDVSIKLNISSLKDSLLLQISQNHLQAKKKAVDAIAEQIREQLNKLKTEIHFEALDGIRKENQKAARRESLHSSQKLFLGSPTLVRIRESLLVASEGKEIETLETTYYVDPEGYLLDKNHFYILNAQGGQIQLSLKQVELLRNYQMYIARHDCN